MNGNRLNFYFNRKIATKYGLSNPNRLRRSMIELVQNGFVEVVFIGWAAREKSVYRFSDKWRFKDAGKDIELSKEDITYINGRKKSK